MRRLRYNVASSLDGSIAGPSGEYDWIVAEPANDFAALFGTFDTVLTGRRTDGIARGQPALEGMRTDVFSRTLRPDDCHGVTLVNSDAEATVAALRVEEGKDIWLMGGGVLFRSLLGAGLVDSVEVALIPTLLGQASRSCRPPRLPCDSPSRAPRATERDRPSQL